MGKAPMCCTRHKAVSHETVHVTCMSAGQPLSSAGASCQDELAMQPECGLPQGLCARYESDQRSLDAAYGRQGGSMTWQA